MKAKKELQDVIIAGSKLSNIAYNGKQCAEMPEEYQKHLADGQAQWDKAIDAYREAIKSKPTPSRKKAP